VTGRTPITDPRRNEMQQYLLTVFEPTGGVLEPDALAAIMKDVEAVDREMHDATAASGSSAEASTRPAPRPCCGRRTATCW
jgi:hypothetical protein